VPEKGLNRLVIHTESVEIGRQPATERMPPTPPLVICRENRLNVPPSEGIEIDGLTIPCALEYKARLWIIAFCAHYFLPSGFR
jgi:hypothetical protein